MYKLRELQKEDLRTINKWRNDPNDIDLLGAPYRYINMDVEMKWYDNYMVNRNNSIRCVITNEEDEPIGLVSLLNIDFMNQSATFHIMIGDNENQGKGAGSYALNQMLQHAFFNMNLQRVDLSVLPTNSRAIHLYEKFGFQREGVKRKARFKNGIFVDMIEYSLLRDEYVLECGGGYSRVEEFQIIVFELLAHQAKSRMLYYPLKTNLRVA